MSDGLFINATPPITHSLAKSVTEVLNDARYRVNAEKIAETFRKAGGPARAAEVIEQKMKHTRKH